MNRLTKKSANGDWCVDGDDCYDVWTVPKSFAGVAVNRLAAYEDTGLSPEEVSELARAKADGRLVVLPCKVGDTVYRVYNTKGCSNCWKLDSACNGISCPEPRIHVECFKYPHLQYMQDIFLTREEAEAALAAKNAEV